MYSSLQKLRFGSMEKRLGIHDDASSSGCDLQKDDRKGSTLLTTRKESSAEGISMEVSSSNGLSSSSGEIKATMDANPGLAYQTSIRSDVTTVPGLQLNKMEKHLDFEMEVSKLDNIEESFKVKAESSSSNSSHPILSGSSNSKSHPGLSLEVTPCRRRAGKVSSYKGSRSSSLDALSGETIGFSSVDSVDPKVEACIRETRENITASNQPNTCDSPSPTQLLYSGKTQRSRESSQALAFECNDDELQVAASLHLHEFDLNVDIGTNEGLIAESGFSCHKMVDSDPIAVVAKVGVPVGLPRTPLQFGGELGWRRSSTASAFRPAENKFCHTRQSISCSGIDLNIAFGTDDLEMEPAAHALVPSTLPANGSFESSSKPSERLILDLNHQSQNDGHQHKKSRVHGFDLNDKLSDEPNFQNSQPPRSSKPVDTGAPFKGSCGQPNCDSTRPAYWVDLSSIPGFAHVQGHSFLVAAPGMFNPSQQMQAVVPLQSKVAFTASTPPGIYLGPTNNLHNLPSGVYSPSILPHLSGQRAANLAPQMSGPILAAYPGNLHLLESAQRLSPHGYSNLRPSFVLSNGVALENGNRGSVMKEFLVPSRNTIVDERMKSVQQVAMSHTSMKRREPEGGWDSCSLSLEGRSRGNRIG